MIQYKYYRKATRDDGCIFVDESDNPNGPWARLGINPPEPEDGEKSGKIVCWDDTIVYTLSYDQQLHDYVETGDKCPEEPVTPTFDYEVVGSKVMKADGSVAYTGSSFTTALQWASNQVDKITHIPIGTYTVTSAINMKKGITLNGDGDNTVLNFTYKTNGKGRGLFANNVNGVTVKNLKITGTGTLEFWVSNNLTVGGHRVQDVTIQDTVSVPWAFATWCTSPGVINDVKYERCKAINTSGFGFQLGGNVNENTAIRTQNIWAKNIYYTDCLSQNNGRTTKWSDWVGGYDLAEGTNVRDIYVNNCKSINNNLNGFHLESAPLTLNVRYNECESRDNGGYGWMCRKEPGVHEVVFTDCIASGNKKGDWWKDYGCYPQ